jgi:hypothetical protein
VARSKARVEAVVCSGPGSRTAGGGSTDMSRETVEQERVQGSKNC